MLVWGPEEVSRHCPLSLGALPDIKQVCMAGLPKNGNRAPIAGGGRGRHNLHRIFQTAVTAPPRVCCVVWSHVSRGKHTLPQYREYFWHRPETCTSLINQLYVFRIPCVRSNYYMVAATNSNFQNVGPHHFSM